MKFAEKLFSLRKAAKMSQEDLAEILGVSRQAVQKWEAGASSPDMKNLIALSEHFSISLDVLLKDELTFEGNPAPGNYGAVTGQQYGPRRRSLFYEYKSEKNLWGLPLVHIKFGYPFCTAKGVIAIGNAALGFLAIGGFSLGLLACGGFSLGLFALGGFNLGVAALGGLSVGLIACGGIALGGLAVGGITLGRYAAGGIAVASRIALGAIAQGHLAIGDRVKGMVEITPLQQAVDNPRLVGETILQIWPKLAKLLVRFFQWVAF